MTSKYFSGFCLENEKELFNEFLIEGEFNISGFSYGAIQAFESALNSTKRVDLLQLFSPAYFQEKSEKYIRMQLLFFKKDSNSYCENFLKNVSFPSTLNMKNYFNEGTYEELEELLTYKWEENKLKTLLNKGTKVEVYLGEKDKIIDSGLALDFFKEFATVYFIKNTGHILN